MRRGPLLMALALAVVLSGCGDTTDGAGTPNADGSVSCTWVDASGGRTVPADTPPDDVPGTGAATVTLTLGQGDLVLTLDRAGAPCATASFLSLAEQGFFDGSPCHREVNMAAFGVLQCGDPTGTGTGGPPYRFAQEVSSTTSYPRGTVAMANSGSADSTGSQFFLCFTDADLSPDYTVVGTVDDAGLAVLDEIAAAGNDGSLDPSPGGGAPNTPVTITSAVPA